MGREKFSKLRLLIFRQRNVNLKYLILKVLRSNHFPSTLQLLQQKTLIALSGLSKKLLRLELIKLHLFKHLILKETG